MKKTTSASITPATKIDREYLLQWLQNHLGDRYSQDSADRGDDSARLWYWGESMYGGYYCEIWVVYTLVCFHADKLRDLRSQASEIGVKLAKNHRWDH